MTLNATNFYMKCTISRRSNLPNYIFSYVQIRIHISFQSECIIVLHTKQSIDGSYITRTLFCYTHYITFIYSYFIRDNVILIYRSFRLDITVCVYAQLPSHPKGLIYLCIYLFLHSFIYLSIYLFFFNPAWPQ